MYADQRRWESEEKASGKRRPGDAVSGLAQAEELLRSGKRDGEQVGAVGGHERHGVGRPTAGEVGGGFKGEARWEGWPAKLKVGAVRLERELRSRIGNHADEPARGSVGERKRAKSRVIIR